MLPFMNMLPTSLYLLLLLGIYISTPQVPLLLYATSLAQPQGLSNSTTTCDAYSLVPDNMHL